MIRFLVPPLPATEMMEVTSMFVVFEKRKEAWRATGKAKEKKKEFACDGN